MSGDAPRTCGWCSRPTLGEVICPTCENLDQRAQPTRLDALPAGKWTKSGGVWHFKADPPSTRFNTCANCDVRCRGRLCRRCWSLNIATADRGRAPHGTHAAYNRHVRQGERPCDECRAAESEYQNPRHRARYAAKKEREQAA